MSIRALVGSLVAAVALAGGPAAAQTYTDPVQLSAGSFSWAFPRLVLNSGQIVGNAYDADSQPNAVFWTSATATPVVFKSNANFMGASPGGGLLYMEHPSGAVTYQASATSAPIAVAFPSNWTGGGMVGLNDLGQIATAVVPGGSLVPVIMSGPTAAAAPLPVGAFGDTEATAINNGGEIVGVTYTAGGSQLAVYWPSATTNPVALNSGGYDHVAALAINDSGAIVGAGSFIGGASVALFWASPSAVPETLPAPSSLTSGVFAVGINSDGDIAGTDGNAQAALVWKGAAKTPAELVAEACPPTNTWKNHGQYVSCVAKAADALVSLGKATKAQRNALVNAAAHSSIGK